MANETERPSVLSMLKLPLLVLAIALVAGGAMLSASYLYLQGEKQASEASRRVMGDAQARMSNANLELESLKNSIDKFNELKSKGAFAQENRLAWLERMLALQKSFQISSLEFDLAARKKPVLQGNRSFSALEIYASPIQVKFRALHDGEALAFIDAINQWQGGLFPLESCSLARSSIAPSSSYQPRIEADCKAFWITLSDKRQPPPAAAKAN